MNQPQSLKPETSWHRFWSSVRRYFLMGFVVAGPLTLTIWITLSLISWVDTRVVPMLPRSWRPDEYLPFAVPGFGLLITFIGLTLLGFLTAGLLGRTFIGYGEYLLNRMPLVRSIYNGLKQVFETLFAQSGVSFRKVGLIEYPGPGLWSLVYYSLPPAENIRKALDGDDMIGVFLPCAPNPTTGFFLYIERSKIRDVDIAPEAAAKLIMSAGVIVPEDQPAESSRSASVRPKM